MTHRRETARLSRQNSHRKATVESLVRHLLMKNRIRTTQPKAHVASRLMDHLITLGKKGEKNLSANRALFRYLKDRQLVYRLVHTVSPLFKDRRGGYTRIIKLIARKGDRAPMAILELVEFPFEEAKKESRPSKTEAESAPIQEKESVQEKAAQQEDKGSFLSGLKKFFRKR